MMRRPIDCRKDTYFEEEEMQQRAYTIAFLARHISLNWSFVLSRPVVVGWTQIHLTTQMSGKSLFRVHA